ERDALAAKLKEVDGRIDDLLATCHRLALELECLLLDTKDSALVSRWWDPAMAALDGWHKAKDAASARPVPAEPVNARLLDVAVWPAGYCRDPNGKMSIPAGKEEDFNFGYDVGFQEAWEILNSAISAAGKSPTSQQERLLQDMHDAGREIDRVMAEAAPKAPQVDFEAIARAIWNVRREGEDRCHMELEDLGTDHSVWEEASEVASILEDAGIEVAE
uniref:hypothetical protein n=1 Tax=Zoogloea sp. TaxID=49181 RepID=UPI002C55E16C